MGRGEAGYAMSADHDHLGEPMPHVAYGGGRRLRRACALGVLYVAVVLAALPLVNWSGRALAGLVWRAL